MENPAIDYRKFAKDMIKLCKKHGVKIIAYSEGNVLLGPADAKTFADYQYSDFEFSPSRARIGLEFDSTSQIDIKMET